MKNSKFRVIMNVTVLFLLCFSMNIFAEYVEGIDTTTPDISTTGFQWGLDSTFRIRSTYGDIIGDSIINYHTEYYGYLNCSFTDINIFPDIIKKSLNPPEIAYCFVVKNKKNNTYAKIQVIEKLSDSRFVYKYGKNTTPNDHMLVPSTYDRSIKYKPNNLHSLYNAAKIIDTLTWDPPLPNDNHLIGYILYVPKKRGYLIDTTIDTTKPINMAQWDSVAFLPSSNNITTFYPSTWGLVYYLNLVAVYDEGKAEFINGWASLDFSIFSLQIKPRLNSQNNGRSSFLPTGYFATLSILPSQHFTLSLLNLRGTVLVHYSCITSNNPILSPSKQHIPVGLYLLRAEFPDRSVVVQPFMLTR